MEQKNIILGITGSIAAYKGAELANLLTKEGKAVHTIMTKAGMEFITPLTLKSLTKQRVYHDMFDEVVYEDIRHISLTKRADVFVIAPATANIIGKIASGIADDMLSTVVMATTAPVIICPAMNTAMYENPIVQQNIKKLESVGYIFVEPKESRLACGDLGKGAMADVAVIVDKINHVLGVVADASPKPKYTPTQTAQYSLEDVAEHLNDPQIAQLFAHVEDIWGKLLKDSERQMYLGFYEDLGLPIDVIEFLLHYCIDIGKKNNNYIQTVAQNWADEGIFTKDAASEHIRLFNNEYREILRYFGIVGREPIAKEVEYMKRWLVEDGFNMSIIQIAAEKAITNTAKAPLAYADGILNKYKESAITTVAQIEALEKDYYDNIKSFKRPTAKKAKPAAKTAQNYKGRKWDYEKLAQMEKSYIDKKVGK